MHSVQYRSLCHPDTIGYKSHCPWTPMLLAIWHSLMMKWKPPRGFNTSPIKLGQRAGMGSFWSGLKHFQDCHPVTFHISTTSSTTWTTTTTISFKHYDLLLVGGGSVLLFPCLVHLQGPCVIVHVFKPDDLLLVGGGWGATRLAKAPSSKSRLSWWGASSPSSSIS